MPWAPELFSAPTLARLQDKRRQPLVRVPYFDGLMAGEPDALSGSFVGIPELHDPVRGRVKGARAFTAFVSETSSWLRRDNAVEEIESVHAERHSFGEFVLHLDDQNGRVDLPVAIVADRRPDRRIEELRLYFSSWLLAGRHAIRPPLLQPDPDLRVPDVVGDYQRAFAAGDLEAIVAAFEPDRYAREPAGGEHVHEGPDGLRAFYELAFSNDGGVPLEHCALIDDGRACALEYNEVRWGRTELPPQAGVSVYVRGRGGKLAAARIYEDAAPPLAALA